MNNFIILSESSDLTDENYIQHIRKHSSCNRKHQIISCKIVVTAILW